MAQKPAPADRSDEANESAVGEASSPNIRKVCGIVMPIASMGERYPEAHWTRVRLVLQRAIERAGMNYQLVWENPEVDVIQSAILQNLYENDVVICDVSNLNPNVMLETGLRLSTKRPTIIVTDKELRPPFDISTIGYLDYQRDLEYNATESFISRLSKKIEEVHRADIEGRYQSYISQFRFETVQPVSVTVSSDDYIKEKIEELSSSVRILIRSQKVSSPIVINTNRNTKNELVTIFSETASVDANQAKNIEFQIDNFPHGWCVVEKVGDDIYRFNVKTSKTNEKESSSLYTFAMNIIEHEKASYIPF